MKDNRVDIKILGIPFFNCEFNTPEWFCSRKRMRETQDASDAALSRLQKAFESFWCALEMPESKPKPRKKRKTDKQLRTLEFRIKDELCCELRMGENGPRLYDGPITSEMVCMPGTTNLLRIYTWETEYPAIDDPRVLGLPPVEVKRYLPNISIDGPAKCLQTCDTLNLDVNLLLRTATETGGILMNEIGHLIFQWKVK